MPDRKPDFLDPAELRQRALSRWDNEGGAGPLGPQESVSSNEHEIPELTNTELVQLRIRVIALENLVITLLAGSIRPAARPCSRDGSLHFSEARLHPPPPHNPCGSPDDRSC